jgi:hypothetical protein
LELADRPRIAAAMRVEVAGIFFGFERAVSLRRMILTERYRFQFGCLIVITRSLSRKGCGSRKCLQKIIGLS